MCYLLCLVYVFGFLFVVLRTLRPICARRDAAQRTTVGGPALSQTAEFTEGPKATIDGHGFGMSGEAWVENNKLVALGARISDATIVRQRRIMELPSCDISCALRLARQGKARHSTARHGGSRRRARPPST